MKKAIFVAILAVFLIFAILLFNYTLCNYHRYVMQKADETSMWILDTKTGHLWFRGMKIGDENEKPSHIVVDLGTNDKPLFGVKRIYKKSSDFEKLLKK